MYRSEFFSMLSSEIQPCLKKVTLYLALALW